ncbi:LacI family DNA-binding transcriptional regulator [Actinoplanes sp. CA-054009]
MTGKPATINDVARAAGVASSTVSRAFARPGRVNVETAERIRRVAADLGYRSGPVLRPAPRGRTSMIGLVISDVTNPFYDEIIRGAQAAAGRAGRTTLLADAQENGVTERDVLERAVPLVDGLVLATSRMSDSAIRQVAKQCPVVVLNRIVAGVPSVVVDNPRGARRVAEHLGELGHRHLTYVAGPEASWTDGVRWRALRELDVHAHRIGPFEPTVAGGAEAAQEFARRPTSAVVAYNDLMAIGLIRRLTAMGVRVPGDVSVAGFDNIFAAELITPALTTVAAPLHAMGEAAVRAVLSGAGSSVVTLPTRLVVRASTGRRRGKAWQSMATTAAAAEARLP